MNVQDNNKLVNKGWAAMSSLLDEQMPVRRKSIWFWWLLGIGIPTAVAGLLIFKTFNQPQLSSQQYVAEQAEILPLNLHEETSIITNDLKEIHASDLLSNGLEKKDRNPDISLAQNANIKVTKSSPSKSPIVKKQQESIQLDETLLLETNDGQTIRNKEIHRTVAVPIRQISEHDYLEILAINSLPVSFVNQTEMQASNFTLTYPEVKHKSKSLQKLHFTIKASVYNSLYNIPGGYDLGIGVRNQFSKRWSIYADLSYARYFRSGYEPVFSFSPINASDTYFEEANNLDYVNLDKSFASYEQAVPLVNRLDYLQIPIGVRYNVHPRWEIGVGGRFAYLLNGRNESGNNFAVKNAIQDGLGVSDLLFEKDYYKSFDLALNIDCRYRINKAWSIGIQWSRGLINILDVEKIQGSTQRKDFNRDLGINLSYSF